MIDSLAKRFQGACETSDQQTEPGISLTIRIINAIAVVLPFAGVILAVVLLVMHGTHWAHFCAFGAMYVLTALGITIGFHRLFTHRAFEAPRAVRVLLAILGSMAVEGPLLDWVATHRRHHQHSDDDQDPHSPHLHGHGLRGMLKGLWHAHIGWIFEPNAPGLARYVQDLQTDRALRAISKLFPLWALIGMLIPAAVGGLVTMTWTGALVGFLWGGLARVFLVHHVTWSINSICHFWGTQPFRSHDESRNNFLFGVFGFGEGWHNNHHAFPTSARHGLRWWEIDISYWVIRSMELVGLARRVRVPTADALAAKRRTE